MGGGRFEGTLPAELGMLQSLEELWCAVMHPVHRIDSPFHLESSGSMMPSRPYWLRRLNIHAISGTIPVSFGNLGACSTKTL